MTPADMDELSRLFLHASPTAEERRILVDAVQDVDTLADLRGRARIVLNRLRKRVS